MARTSSGAGPGREDETPTNTQWAQILQSLQTMTALLQQQQQTHQAPPAPPQPAPIADPVPPQEIPIAAPALNLDERKTKLLREFQKQNPPEFIGDPDPQVAERWLKQTRKVLDIVGTPAEY